MEKYPMHLLTLYNVKCRSGDMRKIGPDDPPWMGANLDFRCRAVAEFGPRFELKVTYHDAERQDINLMMIESFVVRSARPKVVLECAKFNFSFQIKTLKYKGCVQVESILSNCREVLESGIVPCNFSEHQSVLVKNVPSSPVLKTRSVFGRVDRPVIEGHSKTKRPVIEPFWKPARRSATREKRRISSAAKLRKPASKLETLKAKGRQSQETIGASVTEDPLTTLENPIEQHFQEMSDVPLQSPAEKQISENRLTSIESTFAIGLLPEEATGSTISTAKKPQDIAVKKSIKERLREISEMRLPPPDDKVPKIVTRTPVIARVSENRKLSDLIQSMEQRSSVEITQERVEIVSFKTAMQREKQKENRPVWITNEATLKKAQPSTDMAPDVGKLDKQRMPDRVDQRPIQMERKRSPLPINLAEFNAFKDQYPRTEDGPTPIKLARYSATDDMHPTFPEEQSLLVGHSSISSGGFENLGNTCYMNAVLQCLFGLQTFQQDILGLSFAKLDSFPGNSVFRALMQLLNGRFYPSMIKRGLLEDLKEAITVKAAEFEGFQQHDAHEFIRIFLNLLKNEITGILGERVITRYSSSNSDCPVTRNFSFKVQQYITCMRCSTVVEKEEEWFDFPLSLDSSAFPNKLEEVQKLFDKSFKQEEIEFNCRSCNCRKASKRILMASVPRVLTVYLKRYVYDRQRRAQKIHRIIDINKTLSLADHTIADAFLTETRAPMCQLACIVSHIGGTPTSGHYIADVKVGDKWKCFDDNVVTDIQEDDMLRRRQLTAYILFYVNLSA